MAIAVYLLDAMFSIYLGVLRAVFVMPMWRKLEISSISLLFLSLCLFFFSFLNSGGERVRHMDRPKIDGIVDYIKAAYPDSWRDYVLCRAGTEEPIAVVFPHMGRIYYAPTLSMFEKAGPHGRHFGE